MDKREVALLEERLGSALMELEKVKGKYAALNEAYKELLGILFNSGAEDEPRHIFYSEEDIK